MNVFYFLDVWKDEKMQGFDVIGSMTSIRLLSLFLKYTDNILRSNKLQRPFLGTEQHSASDSWESNAHCSHVETIKERDLLSATDPTHRWLPDNNNRYESYFGQNCITLITLKRGKILTASVVYWSDFLATDPEVRV
jgi:hypothetical protein